VSKPANFSHIINLTKNGYKYLSSPDLHSEKAEHYHRRQNTVRFTQHCKTKDPSRKLEKNCWPKNLCPELHRAVQNVVFLANQKKMQQKDMKVNIIHNTHLKSWRKLLFKEVEDWKFVALVVDRLFLWIFSGSVILGTAGILLQAPTLYDQRQPIDHTLSGIGLHHHAK